ncbi:hypothetical protein M9458_045555, partial [Cirrhinus mrigala]
VQSAMQRKFAQHRGQWKRRSLVTNDSHCNYHTKSSITETSRVSISLDNGPTNTNGGMHMLNGQSNGKRRSSNEPDSCDLPESTEI